MEKNEYEIGDLVMFKPEGRYAKWFGGRLAVIESLSDNGHCRVKWLTPVKYYDNWATVSDFGLDRFIKHA